MLDCLFPVGRESINKIYLMLRILDIKVMN